MPMGVYPRKKRSLDERFWPRVQKTDTCWLWTGARQPKGYGLIAAGGRGGPALLAHRVSYTLTRGAIPNGMELDHLCKIRHCVNPDHLEPVTHSLNVARGDHSGPNQRNKRKTHCPQGHEYNSENTRLHTDGSRQCRICENARRRTGWRKRGPDKKPRTRRHHKEPQ